MNVENRNIRNKKKESCFNSWSSMALINIILIIRNNRGKCECNLATLRQPIIDFFLLKDIRNMEIKIYGES